MKDIAAFARSQIQNLATSAMNKHNRPVRCPNAWVYYSGTSRYICDPFSTRVWLGGICTKTGAESHCCFALVFILVTCGAARQVGPPQPRRGRRRRGRRGGGTFESGACRSRYCRSDGRPTPTMVNKKISLYKNIYIYINLKTAMILTDLDLPSRFHLFKLTINISQLRIQHTSP